MFKVSYWIKSLGMCLKIFWIKYKKNAKSEIFSSFSSSFNRISQAVQLSHELCLAASPNRDNASSVYIEVATFFLLSICEHPTPSLALKCLLQFFLTEIHFYYVWKLIFHLARKMLMSQAMKQKIQIFTNKFKSRFEGTRMRNDFV